MLHGDLRGGVAQYWVGAFNGKGTLGANTTNEPEVVGRLKFYPWKKSANEMLKGFTIAGSIAHGRTRGLSNELSFNGQLPDNAFTFFPRFAINGPVERYEGDVTWVKGPWAVRAEYDQLDQFRRALSSFAGGTGQNDLPGVVAKAYYAGATYLLTGERRPENGRLGLMAPFSGRLSPVRRYVAARCRSQGLLCGSNVPPDRRKAAGKRSHQAQASVLCARGRTWNRGLGTQVPVRQDTGKNAGHAFFDRGIARGGGSHGPVHHGIRLVSLLFCSVLG